MTEKSDTFRELMDELGVTFKNLLVQVKEFVGDGGLEYWFGNLSHMILWTLAVILGFVATTVTNILYMLNNFERIKYFFFFLSVLIGGMILAFKPLLVILGLMIFLFNDLMSWFRGGKSYIRDFIVGLTTLDGWWNAIVLTLWSFLTVGTAVVIALRKLLVTAFAFWFFPKLTR